jgi:hypothetical protein
MDGIIGDSFRELGLDISRRSQWRACEVVMMPTNQVTVTKTSSKSRPRVTTGFVTTYNGIKWLEG